MSDKEDSTEDKPAVYCSFCGASNKDKGAEKTIAGADAAICGECIALCVSILLVPSKRISFVNKDDES